MACGRETMSDLDFYDDMEDAEFWDLEDDWEDGDEPDRGIASGLLGAGLGAAAGSVVGNLGFDAGEWLGKKGMQAIFKTDPAVWDTDRYKYWRDIARNTTSNALAGVGGTLGAFAGAMPSPEDTDPYEPEYSAEDIDLMEALAEEAVEAEGEDSVIAGDEMVSRSFGMMRAAPRVRPIIAALQVKVRRILAMARRDPRYRVLARVAPLALRRTASTLMRMAVARKPVTTRTALMLFSRMLGTLMRAPNTRAKAVRQGQVRARRHRARRGLPAPTRVRRPVYARQPVRSRRALARPAYA